MSSLISYTYFPPGSALLLRRLAHDLMGPLTVLAGNLQLFALRNDLPDTVIEKVEELYEQTNVLVNLIRKSSSYAGEKNWSGDSGNLQERFEDGAFFAGSVLARNGIQTQVTGMGVPKTFQGEPQLWTEWFAALLASIATFMEPRGKINLSAIEKGFRLQASPIQLSNPIQEEWISALKQPSITHSNPAVRYYAIVLLLNQIKCDSERQNDTLILNFTQTTI